MAILYVVIPSFYGNYSSILVLCQFYADCKMILPPFKPYFLLITNIKLVYRLFSPFSSFSKLFALVKLKNRNAKTPMKAAMQNRDAKSQRKIATQNHN